MKQFLIAFFLGSLILFLSTYDFTPETVHPVHPVKALPQNPIDKILGEKELDNGTFRKDNFYSIVHIKASYLKDSSELYAIQEVRQNLFLLTRKKFYYGNRRYSLFVKTEGNRIVSVYEYNDSPVKGVVAENDKIYMMQGDYTEIASHWQPTYTIKISCLDLNFRELWCAKSRLNTGYYFLGTRLKLQDELLIAEIGIQSESSSTMCVSNYNLSITTNGEITSVSSTGGYLCGSTLPVQISDVPGLFETQMH